MTTGRIVIKETVFEVWLALTPDQQQRGLQHVTQDALAPLAPEPAAGLPAGAERGMLFVFPDEELRAFWMHHTIIPLDIAYLRSDGRIVSTHSMAPLETRLYPSVEPARFALEVRAGLLGERGIAPGDRAEIPPALLKVPH